MTETRHIFEIVDNTTGSSVCGRDTPTGGGSPHKGGGGGGDNIPPKGSPRKSEGPSGKPGSTSRQGSKDKSKTGSERTVAAGSDLLRSLPLGRSLSRITRVLDFISSLSFVIGRYKDFLDSMKGNRPRKMLSAAVSRKPNFNHHGNSNSRVGILRVREIKAATLRASLLRTPLIKATVIRVDRIVAGKFSTGGGSDRKGGRRRGYTQTKDSRSPSDFPSTRRRRGDIVDEGRGYWVPGRIQLTDQRNKRLPPPRRTGPIPGQLRLPPPRRTGTAVATATSKALPTTILAGGGGGGLATTGSVLGGLAPIAGPALIAVVAAVSIAIIGLLAVKYRLKNIGMAGNEGKRLSGLLPEVMRSNAALSVAKFARDRQVAGRYKGLLERASQRQNNLNYFTSGVSQARAIGAAVEDEAFYGGSSTAVAGGVLGGVFGPVGGAVGYWGGAWGEGTATTVMLSMRSGMQAMGLIAKPDVGDIITDPVIGFIPEFSPPLPKAEVPYEMQNVDQHNIGFFGGTNKTRLLTLTPPK